VWPFKVRPCSIPLTVEDNVALPLREHTALAPSIIDLMVWMKLAAVVGLADFGKLHPRHSQAA
jgi:ABC-type transporter Mla maintaining outer membrane lipid asymmetry ATPase subunit MlaF